MMNSFDRGGRLRRLVLLLLVLVSTAAAARVLASVLAADGLSVLEIGILGLFTLTFAWIACAFWTALVGFGLHVAGTTTSHLADLLKRPPPVLPPAARTALVVPVYHEDADEVAARLAAVYRSLEQTGQLDIFDLFILSDSRDPAVRRQEEAAWARLCQEVGGGGRIFYRHRPENRGRKAGNIAEFCERWGRRYAYFVVLDADSVMSGETLVRLVQLMEAEPGAGLIQTVPQPTGSTTLFARIQQFAARLYSPIYAAGAAFWFPGRSNYWGHNAIIRTRAFMASAGLPTLPGSPPLGGEILSHDFVEAALLQRAGWSVWLVPELGGSFEQLPPTLTDYAVRDRRWCQGNLQHLRLVTAKGLRPVSRAHLTTGAMSYLASPFWFLLLLLSTIQAAQLELTDWVYFPNAGSLFPVWPVAKTFELIGLFSVTMAMLILPKFLALGLALARPAQRRAFGGAGALVRGVLAEIAFSVLLAPILMVRQTQAVLGTLLGGSVGWTAQQRGERAEGWRAVLAAYGGVTLLGALWALVAYQLAPGLLAWLSPVLAGLLLAVPIVAISGRRRLGAAARARRWFLTPDEIAPPPELAGLDAPDDATVATTRRAGAGLLAPMPLRP
jgi:membrane glycosyltransferase